MVKESQHLSNENGLVSALRKNGSLDRSSYKDRLRTGSSAPLSSKKTSNINEIVIVKVAKKGLGIGLASFGTQGKYDYGIYVKYIAKGSPAATHGNLRLKDVLLSINHESLDDKSVDDIYRILRNISPGPVNLLIKRSSNSTEDGGDVRISSPKKEGKGEIASLMAPALPSKGRQSGPIIRYDHPKSSKIPVSSSLQGSKSDLKKEMLNKQNWFMESTTGKKPATKGSLGIEYGRNVNSSLREKRRFSDDLKENTDSTDEGKSSPGKPMRCKPNMTNLLPDQATLDTILQPVKPGSLSLNTSDQNKPSLHTSPCKEIEIPEGMEAYNIDIIKDEKASLGISLVPATGKCSGLFLVRFIFPGTAAANNGKIFCGDCIFSLNGIKLSNMSHPQAIHLLKKCTNKGKLIVFREKKDPLSKQISKNKKDNDLQADILPGTISDTNFEKEKQLLLHEKLFKSKFFEKSPIRNESDVKKIVTKFSESEDTEDERISDDTNTIPNFVSTNKRSKYLPFLIEVEKKSKTLGIEVMMDESGQCNITDISKTGDIAHDKRIRVGDIIIAINNQSLDGKPISDVKGFIRRIPRGAVQLILKTSDTESESSQTTKSVKNNSISGTVNRDDDSASLASSFGSHDDHSDRLSVASLALPPDNSYTQRVTTTISKEKLSAPFDDDVITAFITNPKLMRDDMSEVASLPPAPPRPIVSKKVFDSMHDPRASFSSKRKDLDAMSDVMSLPPAPPRPSAPMNLMNDLDQGSSEEDDDSMTNEVGNVDNDSDVESTFSCIPAPPAPVGVQNMFRRNISSGIPGATRYSSAGVDSPDGRVNSKVYAETPLSIMAKSGSLLSLTSGSHKDILSNYSGENEETTRRKSVIDYLEQTEDNISGIHVANDNRDKNEEVDEDFTPAIFDIKEILDSPAGSTNYRSRNTSLSSHESVSVYPEGIVVYNENNGKVKNNLFSKLKSKILLPSKGNAKEYSRPTKNDPTKAKKEKKKNKPRPASALEFYDPPKTPKDKKKKKRPVSALDFSEESSRNMIKASISQPDLTNLSSREVDMMFKRKGSEPRDIRPVQDWMVDPGKQRNASPSSIESAFSSKSQLPRILPDKKLKNVSRKNSRRYSSDDEKKYKKRNSFAPSISPPRTPPPPPPSEFNVNDEIDDPTPDNYVPSNEYNIEYPEKLLLSGEPIYTKSMSDSSSSIPGSYAAYGPTITSANASLENLDATYDVVDGIFVLNHTYDVSGKPSNDVGRTTYDVNDETVNNIRDDENLYESIDNVLTKSLPPQKPSRKLSNSYGEPKLTSSHVPSEQNSLVGEYHQVGEESPPIPIPTVFVSSETITVSTSSTTFTIPTQTQGKRHPSLLSDKDKYDPKLQPFIMTKGVSALLSTWPSKTSSSPYSEYDDDGWGSEFSSNVLDSSTFDSTMDQNNVTRRLPALNNLENTSDGTYTLEYCNSTTENPARIRPAMPLPLTPKPKGGNFKQFFSRAYQNENEENGGKLTLGKKEKQKVVRPTILPDEENRIPLFSESSTPNENKDVVKSMSTVLDESLKNKKNPIAKPPRRKSGENVLTSSSESPYENLSSYNRTQEFRPVPPLSDNKEVEAPVLSPEEHQLLYASVDYGSKINRRQDADNTYTLTNHNTRNTSKTDDDNGYLSDGTVYSIPERNNTPEFNPQGTSTCVKGGYSSIKDSATESSNYTTAVNHGFGKERRNEIFGIELTKEHGKCLGISLIGGSDTPIVKNLVKSIDKGSIASRCRIPLEPGDEIIEVNGTMVVGYAHSQLLCIIRESPPLLKLQIHRSADGNIHLLRQQRANEKIMDRKIDNEKIIANLAATCHNTKGSEIVSVEKVGDQRVSDSPNGLTVDTFDAKHQQTKAHHPFHPPSNLDHNVKVVEIELHKEDGRGLGISVAGGPKLVITKGIKVKRLAPNSVAYMDGRLQKGDRIVAINGKDIYGMTQGDALNMLQNIKTTVILTAHRSVSPPDEQIPQNIYVSELNAQPDLSPEKPLVGILKKSSSETHLPKTPKECDKMDSNARKSRSETKKNAEERSRSENREMKRKSSTRSRSRSPGIFSRIFRGSERSLGKTRKNSEAGIDCQPSGPPKEKILNFPPQTIYFGKTSSSVDFTLTRGGKMYGDTPPVIQTIRKGTALAKTLLVGDMILSVNGVDLQDYSDADLKSFLRSLPKGTIPMVVRRV